jgi:hypothetical protein
MPVVSRTADSSGTSAIDLTGAIEIQATRPVVSVMPTSIADRRAK